MWSIIICRDYKGVKFDCIPLTVRTHLQSCDSTASPSSISKCLFVLIPPPRSEVLRRSISGPAKYRISSTIHMKTGWSLKKVTFILIRVIKMRLKNQHDPGSFQHLGICQGTTGLWGFKCISVSLLYNQVLHAFILTFYFPPFSGR